MEFQFSRMLSIAAAAAVLSATACDRDAQSSGTASTSAGKATGSDARATGTATRAKKQSTSYLGLQYDSLPSSFTYKGGSVIPRAPRGPAMDYDFAHVATPRGE